MAFRRGRVPLSVTLVTVAAFAFSACGSGPSTVGISVAAGRATTVAGSFRVNIEARDFDVAHPSRLLAHSTGTGFVDVAGGRSHMTTQGGPDGTETQEIRIGADRWILGGPFVDRLTAPGFLDLSSPGRTPPRPWLHLKSSATAARVEPYGIDPTTVLRRLEESGDRLDPAGRENVRGVPTRRYRITGPGGTTTSNAAGIGLPRFDVWIDAGNLVRRVETVVTLPAAPDATPPEPARSEVVTFEFYDFGAHEDVRPPAPDQVADAPSLPACGTPESTSSTEVLQACSVDPSSPPASAPDLPSPAITGPSPLDFRPVLADHAGACPAAPAVAPAPDQPVTLPGPDGSCLDLGPSGLTVTHARAAVQPGSGPGVQVSLTLGDADSAALDRMAGANLGNRAAIVMFGRVLSAATINVAEYHGRAAITGLDVQAAADVIAGLSG